MFAVIRTGGKQYRVAANDVIEVERIEGEAGASVQFGEVLMLGGDTPRLGTPLVEGASVAGEVVAQKRAPKIVVFKKKRRKNYRRKHGHRQLLTAVRITEILTDGRAPSGKTAHGATGKAGTKSGDKTGAQAPTAEQTAAAPAEPSAGQD